MCCLFGVLDHHGTLTRRQRQRLVTALSVAAQVRGTDATGLAYISGGRLRICKEPRPARAVHFHLPEDAAVVMGHTRMTTQGNACRNYNNHPFSGRTAQGPFALAHNGVLYNDRYLRGKLHLPETRIETDSYVAVQLIEQQGALDLSSLRYMAEQVEGSFVFTLLDGAGRLYVVRGDNPFCLWYFPQRRCHVYASTEAILREGFRRSRLSLGECQTVPLECGEILRIDDGGAILRGRFDDTRLLFSGFAGPWRSPFPRGAAGGSYLEAVKSVAQTFGYTPEDIDTLALRGFSPEEIEELFYCGEL